MSQRVPMTKGGLLRLKGELKRLKNVERPKIVKEIAEARSHGDLSENAEYHAAKEKQSHVEGRIAQVEHWIASAEVIDVSRHQGDTVVVRTPGGQKEYEIQALSFEEEDVPGESGE